MSERLQPSQASVSQSEQQLRLKDENDPVDFLVYCIKDDRIVRATLVSDNIVSMVLALPYPRSVADQSGNYFDTKLFEQYADEYLYFSYACPLSQLEAAFEVLDTQKHPLAGLKTSEITPAVRLRHRIGKSLTAFGKRAAKTAYSNLFEEQHS